MTITLEPNAPGKRGSVWHVHVIDVEEKEVERVGDW